MPTDNKGSRSELMTVSVEESKLEEIRGLLEPWLSMLQSQSEAEPDFDPDIRDAFFGQWRYATHDLALACQQANLRGLSNTCMMLVRGLDELKSRALTEDDIMQLTLWISGVQSYLDGQLEEPACLLTDLQALRWMPKLAPAGVAVLQDRLKEPQHDLVNLAGFRASANDEIAPNVEVAQADVSDRLPFDAPMADEAFSEEQSGSMDESFSIGASEQAPMDWQLGVEEASTVPVSEALSNMDERDANLLLAGATEALGDTGALSQVAFGQRDEEHAQTFALPFNGAEQADADFDPDAPIWIAVEEFQLVTETVQARLMPQISELAASTDVDQLTAQFTEVQYQIELLGNAFAVLNLVHSQGMCSELSMVLNAPGANTPELIAARAPALMEWIVHLMDLCTNPEDDHSQLFAFLQSPDEWFVPMAQAEAALLKQEIARIRVGLDPSLKAARKTEISEEDASLSPAEDVIPSVLQGMLLELPSNAQNLSIAIENYVRMDAIEAIDEARRVAHTLKGDANTVGIRGIANLTHPLEDIFIELNKNPRSASPEFGDLLIQASDCVSAMADHVLGRGEAPDDRRALMQRVLNIANGLAEGENLDALVGNGESLKSDSQSLELGSDSAMAVAERLAQIAAAVPKAVTAPAPTNSIDVPMLQVPADVLDRLLDFSSEALVLLRQIENQIRSVDEGQNEIERQRQEGAGLLTELDLSVNLRGSALQSARSQGQAVDPLELDQYNELYTVTRRLMEVSADEQSARNVIERAARRLQDLTAEQEKVQLELQDQLMRTRQVNVREFVGRFQRAVRQTAKMLDKDVEFAVLGQDTMIDRVQMESLIDPLMHALRNAVDHGIEGQSLRMTRGKSRTGQVKLSFERDGRSISVKLSDDGAGLNFERIRAKAISRGFISETDELTEDDLAQLILLPGFSTKEEVTQVSGRGIGLDVVYQRIQDLRGTLHISSKANAGTLMDIRLPASMSSLYSALAKLTNGFAVIASDTVESFLLIDPSACRIQGEQMMVEVDGEEMPMLDLESLITGHKQRIRIPTSVGVGVLVRNANGTAQIGWLPEIQEMRTTIVKDFGPYLRSFQGVRGGTILGDGSIAPVIDARELMRSTAYQPWSQRDEAYREALARTVKQRVLITDDSLSVRRALEQLMRDAGFEVLTARDGLEALAVIQKTVPDIMLLDLEMPRMNGLEVTSYVRQTAALKEIPIIMITSRTSEKHVQMAKDAGVTEVLSKPYSEDQLLNLVQDHVGLAPTA
jgi:chemotaxis protein histidine kinase CheA/ActR/RegA family two-component response regulator